MARRLKYLGNELPEGDQRRGGFFPGVPAANFTCEDDKQAEELVASGLYAYVKATAKDAGEVNDGDSA